MSTKHWNTENDANISTKELHLTSYSSGEKWCGKNIMDAPRSVH